MSDLPEHGSSTGQTAPQGRRLSLSGVVFGRPSAGDVPMGLAAAMELAGLQDRLHWLGPAELAAATPRISVIGTRDPSPESLTGIEALAGQLARDGAVIVSGAALGTDMAAHRGALAHGRPTIACLPSGLGSIAIDHWRRDFITHLHSDRLLLVSPFPWEQPVTRQTPIVRNRLTAALGEAMVIGEAPIDSGSHSCARVAMDLRIPIFFLARGRPADSQLAMVHQGMQKKGARRFELDEAFDPSLARAILVAARRHREDAARQDGAQIQLFPDA